MDIIDEVLDEFKTYMQGTNSLLTSLVQAAKVLMKLSYEAIGDEGFCLENLAELIEDLEMEEKATNYDEAKLKEAQGAVLREISLQLSVIDEVEKRAIRHTKQYKKEFGKKIQS